MLGQTFPQKAKEDPVHKYQNKSGLERLVIYLITPLFWILLT